MKLEQTRDGKKLVIKIEGELTAVTAPELNELIESVIYDTDNLVFDIHDMKYTSSAGLRIFMKAQRRMNDKKGNMEVVGANEITMEIFKETGFIHLMNIVGAENQ